MTCPACVLAESNPSTGLTYSDCVSCQARALARSPEAHQRERDPAPLQHAMRRVWPDVDDYKRGRSMVWAWIKRKEARETA